MANPKKPGSVNPTVARYMKGLEERAQKAGEAARKEQPKMPDLAQAHAQYDPQKDGPMTLGQISQAQHTQSKVLGGDGGAPTIKPETLAGLAEIKRMADQQNAAAPTKKEDPTADLPETEVVEREEPVKLSPEEEAEMTAEGISDLDIELMLTRMQRDVIQNEEQQKAIKKKVKPIDFAEGIMTGEFKQVVPIREGLTVTYRTLTPFENEEIRKMILEMQLQDARTASIAAERLSFMQTVAAIVMINGNEMPKHLTKGQTWKFDREVFTKKYNLFSNYPTPFIHTLTSHAYWFDQRVREMFTVETAKNS